MLAVVAGSEPETALSYIKTGLGSNPPDSETLIIFPKEIPADLASPFAFVFAFPPASSLLPPACRLFSPKQIRGRMRPSK